MKTKRTFFLVALIIAGSISAISRNRGARGYQRKKTPHRDTGAQGRKKEKEFFSFLRGSVAP